MTFELSEGVLSDQAPHVWGCPRWSHHFQGWVIDWYDGTGSLEGVTTATPAQVVWCEANAQAVGQMQIDVENWRKR